MLCACIDIGSNTTRLLVGECVDGRLREVVAQRAFTRLGEGLRANEAIAPERVEPVAAVVAAQARLARELGASRIRAVATAAVRRAANGGALCAAVRAAGGPHVEVLDEREEARLAFIGATRTLARPPLGPVAVVDVGGSSTELALGTVAGGVSWWASLRLGSGDLAEDCVSSDPPTARALERMRARVRAAFAGLEVPAAEHALAVGGSATSLRRVVGDAVDAERSERAIGVLAGAPARQVAGRLGLDARRVRLLPAAMLVLAAAAERLGRPLQIANGGLREGVLLELAPAGEAAA